MNINIYVYSNANQSIKKYSKVKIDISKLALRETTLKALAEPKSYVYFLFTNWLISFKISQSLFSHRIGF